MSYTITEDNLERQRLLGQVLEPITSGLLQMLPLRPDARCLDIGCGMGESTRRIARSLGSNGSCIGLEPSAALIERAQSEPWSGARVSFQRGDAAALPFADRSFDFVFARYLLIHMPAPREVLRDMLRVARRGGIVAAQEPDLAFTACHPASWAYERLPELFASLHDARFGRKLVALFRDAGCRSVAARADVPIEADGVVLKRLIRMTFEAIGPALLHAHVLAEPDVRRLRGEFLRVEADASVVVIGSPVITAWTVV